MIFGRACIQEKVAAIEQYHEQRQASEGRGPSRKYLFELDRDHGADRHTVSDILAKMQAMIHQVFIALGTKDKLVK